MQSRIGFPAKRVNRSAKLHTHCFREISRITHRRFLFNYVKLDSNYELYKQILKRTVRVISSDPPQKDGNVRFTTVP